MNFRYGAIAAVLAFAAFVLMAQTVPDPASAPSAANDNRSGSAAIQRVDEVVRSLAAFGRWRQPGSGAIVRTIEAKLKDSVPIHGADFGARCDGASHPLSATFRSLADAQATFPSATSLTDEIDGLAIQAAIDAAGAAGGGTVLLGRSCRTSNTLDNRYSRVLVRGLGADTPHDVFPGQTGTIIIPTVAGTVLRHRTPSASERRIASASAMRNTGGGFVDLTVVGNRVATRLLHVTSIQRGAYRLTLSNSVGAEAALFDTLPDVRTGAASQLGEAGDNQYNEIDLTVQQAPDDPTDTRIARANCVTFDGYDGGGNTSYNYNIQLSCRYTDGTGLLIRNGDNNYFAFFRVGRYGAPGSGRPLLIQARAADGSRATDHNVFWTYFADAAGHIEGASERPGGADVLGTTIGFLDAGNGAVAPTIGGGSTLDVRNAGWRDWSPTYSSGTGAVEGSTVSARQLATHATVTFTLTFRIATTSAGDALHFSLPRPSRNDTVFSGRESASGRSLTCTVQAGSTTPACLLTDASTPIRDGNVYTVTGTYEAR